MGALVCPMLLTISANAQVTGNVKADILNVRSGPSTGYSIVNKLSRNNDVQITDIQGDWFKIQSSNTPAYVHKDYIEYEGVETTVTERVHFRSENKISSDNIIMTIPGEAQIRLLSVEGEFSLIKYQDQFGYVYTPKVKVNNSDLQELEKITGKQIATVNVNILNVRQALSTSSPITAKLSKGDRVEVLNIDGYWVNVKLSNGASGYIHKDYIHLTQMLDLSYLTRQSDLGQEIVDYAVQFVGRPYVYGGNSLTTGIDCSAFTQQMYRHFGINISRTSRTQINDGRRIPLNEVQKGDLIFYGYNGYIDHVAIAAGNNQIVHANSPKTGVIVSNMYYGKPIIGAVRLIDNN